MKKHVISFLVASGACTGPFVGPNQAVYRRCFQSWTGQCGR